LWRPEV